MVFAHGIGGSQDLPISLSLAIAAGCAALAVSFVVLALAWRVPRFDARVQGHPLPGGLAAAVDSGRLVAVTRVVGLLFTAYVAWAALAGPDTLANPTFGVVYVWLWVGLVPASLLLGRFYYAVNPVRSVHWLMSRATGGRASHGMFTLPAWVGCWPATLGLFAFVWMELVFPQSNYLWSLRLWFALYVVIVLVGAALFGDRWIAGCDPFEAYSTLVSHLSFFGRRGDRTLVWRAPLRNLDGLEPVSGLVAMVSVLAGSTAFDSFKESLAWLRFTRDVGIPEELLNTLGLAVFCIVVALLFTAATVATPSVEAVPRRALPGLFAHSIVPIVVGYVTAHYLSFFVEIGQQTLIYASDPMVNGGNLFGTANWQVDYWLSLHPSFLAVTKVGAIVAGHVLGVVAAHDRAMKLLPRRHQITGQLPLLVLMVAFTCGGLYLLLTV